MNKANERRSAAARLEAEKQLLFQKKAEEKNRSEHEEQSRALTEKMARLKALRLARDAALHEAAANSRARRSKKKGE